MKELTIEEKAKRYDKVANKLKGFMAQGVDPLITRADVQDFFPELNESEDERIRKAIINFLHEGNPFKDIKKETRKGWIAWLEKQAEQKPVISDDALREGIAYFGITQYQIDNWLKKYVDIEKQGEQKPVPKFEVGDTMRTLQEANDGYTDGMPVVVSIDNEYYHCTNELIAIKDQDDYEFPPINVKQKPADKVEPKFNEGDWVVIATSDGEKVVQIDLIEYFKSGEPRYITPEGKWFGNGTEAHLWTIKDAKDGDILHATGWHNDCIFIFSGFDNWKFDEPDGEKALATNYCYIHVYSDMIEFGIQGPDYIEINTITPATQIQCDLLFRQMKVNGYEWDADKLALNKIEQKPVVSEDFKTSLKHIMEEAIECGDTHNLEADAEMLFRLTQKQGPAELGKEDEKILKVLISHLEKHGGGIGGYECSFLSDWLKSLKEKVQLKQKWSEKDKEMIQAICTLMKDAEDENKWNCVYLNTSKEVKFSEIRDWLDSLRHD